MRFGRVEGDKEGGEAGFHPVIKTLKPYTLNPSKVFLGEGERDCEREREREREREEAQTESVMAMKMEYMAGVLLSVPVRAMALPVCRTRTSSFPSASFARIPSVGRGRATPIPCCWYSRTCGLPTHKSLRAIAKGLSGNNLACRSRSSLNPES